MGTHDWTGLYATHRSALVAYATPILGSREAAEDVVQDAFVKFSPIGADGERGAGYLYRIVRNLAFDVLKRRRVEARVAAVDLPDWTLPSCETSPEQRASDRQELALVARALDALPAEQRVALEMYRLGGATLEEIAAELGISPSTAHRCVRAALARLAAELARGA